MMSCKQVCDNATEYLETPTSLAERWSLWSHLVVCRHCRRFLRQFNLMVQSIGDKMRQSQADQSAAPSDREIDTLMCKLSGHKLSGHKLSGHKLSGHKKGSHKQSSHEQPLHEQALHKQDAHEQPAHALSH